jgi:hypothetical protein
MTRGGWMRVQKALGSGVLQLLGRPGDPYIPLTDYQLGLSARKRRSDLNDQKKISGCKKEEISQLHYASPSLILNNSITFLYLIDPLHWFSVSFLLI